MHNCLAELGLGTERDGSLDQEGTVGMFGGEGGFRRCWVEAGREEMTGRLRVGVWRILRNSDVFMLRLVWRSFGPLGGYGMPPRSFFLE